MNTFRKVFPNTSTILLAVVYLASIIWFFLLDKNGDEVALSNYLYTLLQGIIPIWGGLYGFVLAKKWGGFSSVVGKFQIFCSAGLVSWGIGSLIFVGYYNLIMHIEVPYPSLADLAYILSWPLWGVGMVYLSRATGVKTALHNLYNKFFVLIIPVVVIIASYYLLVEVARDGVISSSEDFVKIFFDLAYPAGDVVILTLATVIYGLSFKYFGGTYRFAIYVLLFGFFINYCADFSFSYLTTLGTFVPGGISDFLFTTAMFAISYGVNAFDSKSISK